MQLDVMKGMSAALKGRRSVAMPAGWSGVKTKLTTNKNAEVSTLAQSLGLTFGSHKASDALRSMTLNNKAEIGVRRAALQSLLAVKDSGAPAILKQLLQTADLRNDALKGLAAYDDPSTAPAILAVYP